MSPFGAVKNKIVIPPTFRINCCEQGADKKWEIIENIKIQGVFNPWIQWRHVCSIFEKFL